MKNKLTVSFFALAAAIIFTGSPALAQDALEEIVVTGSRVAGYAAYSRTETIPVVHLRRRADFMVMDAYIESDSRDAKTRDREISKTLAALKRTATAAQSIELGLMKTFDTDDTEIEYIVPFAEAEIEPYRGPRPDTTRIAIVVKTPIVENDTTPDAVLERLEDFLDAVPVTGRATVISSGDPGLSLVNISQYRLPLLKKIAADTKVVKEVFGDDYQVQISGLEEPVRWRVVAPMQLAIYFPYYTLAGQD